MTIHAWRSEAAFGAGLRSRALGIALATTACLCAATAAAEGAPLEVVFTRMQHQGALCPEGSIGSAPSELPLDSAAYLPFDAVVETTDKSLLRRCDLKFDLIVPPGYQFSLIDLQVGVNALLRESRVHVSLDYGFEGSASQSVWTSNAGTGNYEGSANGQLREWSPSCDPAKPVRLLVSVVALAAPSPVAASRALETAAKLAIEELTIRVDQPSNKSWRRCDGAPMPEISAPGRESMERGGVLH